MQRKDYPAAIDAYSKALNLVPLNPIYLSNRAAAYSASGQHAAASTDAEMAVAADPTYTKGWSRLGLARFAMGDAKGSMEAYEKGIEYEGSGGSAAMKKGYETAKRKVEDEETNGSGGASGEQEPTSPGGGARGVPGQGAGGMPDLSSLAGMFGGGAGRGGGGGGGMPDLSSIMSNPMFANMAQNVMNNPDMMSNIMNNPRLRQMAEQFGGGGGGGGGGGEGGEGGRGAGGGGGGGMPDISSLMNDPSIAEM
jgi:small glutamine-rich tetratricopeptide repeat-containing protein alpha